MEFYGTVLSRAQRVRSAQVCRTCLQTANLMDISGNERFLSLLSEVLSSNVQTEQRLPVFICEQCLKMLEVTVHFKSLAHRTKTMFTSYIRTGTVWPTPTKLQHQEYMSPTVRKTRRPVADRSRLASIKRRLFEDSLIVDESAVEVSCLSFITEDAESVMEVEEIGGEVVVECEVPMFNFGLEMSAYYEEPTVEWVQNSVQMEDVSCENYVEIHDMESFQLLLNSMEGVEYELLPCGIE